jgi:hypothetical protein
MSALPPLSGAEQTSAPLQICEYTPWLPSSDPELGNHGSKRFARRAKSGEVCALPGRGPAPKFRETRARKIEFREPVQADLGCPVPRAKRFVFRIFRRCDLLSPFRCRHKGRIAIVTTRGGECGGRGRADRRAARMRTAKLCGPGAPWQALSSAHRRCAK